MKPRKGVKRPGLHDNSKWRRGRTGEVIREMRELGRDDHEIARSLEVTVKSVQRMATRP